MTLISSLLGLGAILLSLLGFSFCIAGLAGGWWVKRRIEATAAAAYKAAEEAFRLVDVAFARVRDIFDRSRQSVTTISKAAARLKEAGVDAKAASEPLLEALDAIFRELKAAETWLDSCYAIAQGLGSVSEAAMSSKYAATHEESAAMALAKRGQELIKSVTEIIGKLQTLRQELIELRDSGKLVRDALAWGLAMATDLEGKLDALSAQLERVAAKAAQTRASFGEIRDRIQWWSNLATVVTASLLAWFAISQIVTIGWGWRMLH